MTHPRATGWGDHVSCFRKEESPSAVRSDQGSQSDRPISVAPAGRSQTQSAPLSGACQFAP